jgi:heme/copper-type cytochrome/quinol oxidase subunit 1
MIAHLHLSPEATVTVATGAASTIRSFVTIATLVTVAAQGIFLFNFVGSLMKRSDAVAENPWRATTLEWSLPSPPPLGNFAGAAPVVYRGAYEFGAVKFGAANAEDFASQSLRTESGPPGTLGGTDPGLQRLPPHAAGTP